MIPGEHEEASIDSGAVRITVDDDGTVRPLPAPEDAAQAVMTQVIMDRLSEKASEDIMTYMKLGRVIFTLAHDLDEGTGKFGMALRVMMNPTKRPERDEAIDAIIRQFVASVYKLAEVER